MNKFIKIALVVLAVLGGITIAFSFKGDNTNPVNGMLGFDRDNNGSLPATVKEFDQVGITASASVQGLVKPTAGKVFAIEVINDSGTIKYLQLFDMVKAVVPARAASLSCGFQCQKIYLASNSWASDASLTAKPLGSYQQYASPSLVFSMPIAAATASSSPTVVRIGSEFFSPARTFLNGIMWAVSTNFSTYASPSSATAPAARVKVKVLYE